jgi:Uma2 family endonuclease
MPAERTYVANMPPPASPTLMTADELLYVRVPDKKIELVRGRLIVRELPGFRHGRVTADLGVLLGTHLRAAGNRQVLVDEAGFKLASDPDTVRGPDLAVVSRERIPDPEPAGFLVLAPDLAIEVLSPGDRPGEVLAKVAEWLEAGTRLVWVIDPERRVARIYRADGSESVLTADRSLEGEDVVPGFACALGSIL